MYLSALLYKYNIIFVYSLLCIYHKTAPRSINIEQIKFTRSSLDSSKRLGQLLDPRLPTSGTGT